MLVSNQLKQIVKALLKPNLRKTVIILPEFGLIIAELAA